MTRTTVLLISLIQLFGLAICFQSLWIQPHRCDTSISMFGGAGGVSKLPSPSGRQVNCASTELLFRAPPFFNARSNALPGTQISFFLQQFSPAFTLCNMQ